MKLFLKSINYKLFALFFIIGSFSYSQSINLSSESLQIKKSYDNLINYPDSIPLQKDYIKTFPENPELFKRVFHSSTFDELTLVSIDYVILLKKQSKNHPILVGNKLVNLCIGLKEHDDGAIVFIQQFTIRFANSYFKNFIDIINLLSNSELSTLIGFLADVENHSSYVVYIDFMNRLKENNKLELYYLFEKAKNNRINERHH